eukprot:scaffold624448_cov32-Prasinocladus_malaysianus.AAC.1
MALAKARSSVVEARVRDHRIWARPDDEALQRPPNIRVRYRVYGIDGICLIQLSNSVDDK